MSNLLFHWDLFGLDAEKTAEHFKQHLNEFCVREGISENRTFLTVFPRRCVVTLECDEQHLIMVRDNLKPKRAERVDE
jgi:hypothetical protein